MSHKKHGPPIAKQLERTTDNLLEVMKAYFIEKGQWDFETNAPIKDKK